MYTIGNRLRISLFGRSHADCIGCVVEGLPMSMPIDADHIRKRMQLRKPSDGIGTLRKEEDEVVFEAGVTDGRVTGRYVMFTIANGNRNSSSYSGSGAGSVSTAFVGGSAMPSAFQSKVTSKVWLTCGFPMWLMTASTLPSRTWQLT